MSTKQRKRAKKSSTETTDTVTETVQAAAESASTSGLAVDTAETEDGQSSINLQDLKIGYIVGLTAEDQFVFELFGTNKGLVELLGIHQHASKRVNSVYDDAQMSGDRLMHEVGRAVAAIAQKIDDFQANQTEEDAEPLVDLSGPDVVPEVSTATE